MSEDQLRLRERIRERQCIRSVVAISGDDRIGLHEMMKRLLPVIASGWQFPDRTNVRIDFEGHCHQSSDFAEMDGMLVLERATERGDRLCLRIAYAGQAPLPSVPFIPDEIDLAEDIAERLIEVINRRRTLQNLLEKDEELRRHRDRLEQMVAARTRELESARKSAEAASQAKSRFLSTMSHEIRTPMNAIVSYSHMLAWEGLTPRQADHVQKLVTATSHLRSVVNDILDLSKIEAGKMRLYIRTFRPADVVDHACAMAAAEANAKGLTMIKRLHGLPSLVRGDDRRLGQVLLNMIANAVKFTDRGGVTITACVIAREPGMAMIRFSVRDTGIGMTAEQQARLFVDFDQTDDTIGSLYGGTGLGMSISRRLTNMMDGRIGVESDFGAGSTFWIEIPFRIIEAGARETGSRRAGGGMPGCPEPDAAKPVPEANDEADAVRWLRQRKPRVLVAEDSAINQDVICQLLDRAGVSVTLADNGQEAVDRIRTEPIDLVLMDVLMPVMNGLQATRAIRVIQGCAGMPVIAMTANAFTDDRHHCLAAGMNDHLAKPVVPRELYCTLARWLRRTPDDPLDALVSVYGLDVAAGLNHVQHDTAFYRRMLARFVERHASDGKNLLQLLEGGDLEMVRRGAHVLKSIAGTLGAAEVQRLAAEVEALATQLAGGINGTGIMPAGRATGMIRKELGIIADELARHLDNLMQELTTALESRH